MQLLPGRAATMAAPHTSGKLASGPACASAAAQNALAKQQKKQHLELLEAALTLPQQRTQAHIEQLGDFLSTVHLLRSLQPTALKSLAHAMTGQSVPAGAAVYRQGEHARHLFVVLSGEVAMFEIDSSSTASSSSSLRDSSSPAHGSRMGSSSGLKPPQHQHQQQQQQQQHSPQPQRGASSSSSSSHKPGSPPRLGSSAGQRHAGSPQQPAGGGSGAEGPQWCEVRRVRPREAFGEDDVTAGTRREQTAVSIGATKLTFQAMGSSSSSSSSGGGAAQPPQPPGPAAAAADGTFDSVAAPTAAVAATPAALAQGAAAAAATDPRGQCVLLVLSAADYGAALEGRLTSLLEEKVTFLAGLPAMQGLHEQYLRQLAHCFHQVTFEPREVVVRQGDVSDCLFVVKTGQVCVLIDPNLTLVETAAAASGGSGGDGSAQPSPRPAQPGNSGGGAGAADAHTASELDTKKLVQVCLLGSGAIIGDMAVRESGGPGGGPAPRRSATVIALTELVTFKVPLKEFKRRMPAAVLEGMRQVASQKLEMNGSKAQGRTNTHGGRDGQVLLGGLALPECVLQGKGLRALLDAQEQGRAAPVGGLLQALELCVAPGRGTPGGSSSSSGSGSSQQPAKKWFVSGTKAAQEVEGFMDSLSRSGYVSAPPTEFLALMTDWHSPRTNNTGHKQQVPPGWLFPLPLPSGKQHHCQGSPGSTAALASANSQLHPAMGTLASLAHAACGGAAIDPAVTTHTVCISRPHTPQQPEQQQAEVEASLAHCSLSPAAVSSASLARQPLMSSPTSLLAALSLDQFVQSPLDSPSAAAPSSRHASRPTTPGAAPKGLNAAAVAKDAAQQLLSGSGLSSPKAMTRAAGGMGGRGQLLRGQLAQPGALSCSAGVSSQLFSAAPGSSKAAIIAQPSGPAPPNAAGPGFAHARSTEPTAAEASIKAAALFRPGSPICIARCGSPRPACTAAGSNGRVVAHAGGSGVVAAPPAVPVVLGLTANVHAAVITSSRTGKQELTFHAAAGPGAALQLHNS